MATVLNSNFGPWRVATGHHNEKVGVIDQLGGPCLHFEEDGPIEVTAICKNSPETLASLQQWVALWNEEFRSGSRWPVTATPPELRALEAVWPSGPVAQIQTILTLEPVKASEVLACAGKLADKDIRQVLERMSTQAM